MSTPITMILTKTQRGVALLEALIAVVLLAIGLIGTVGLQARAQATLAQADVRAEAAIATDRLLALMSSDLQDDKIPGYAKTEAGAAPAVIDAWHKEVQKRIPDALVTVAVEKTLYWYKVDVVIKWTRRKGDPQNEHAVTSYISAS